MKTENWGAELGKERHISILSKLFSLQIDIFLPISVYLLNEVILYQAEDIWILIGVKYPHKKIFTMQFFAHYQSTQNQTPNPNSCRIKKPVSSWLLVQVVFLPQVEVLKNLKLYGKSLFKGGLKSENWDLKVLKIPQLMCKHQKKKKIPEESKGNTSEMQFWGLPQSQTNNKYSHYNNRHKNRLLTKCRTLLLSGLTSGHSRKQIFVKRDWKWQ